jgi:hypothetical protein
LIRLLTQTLCIVLTISAVFAATGCEDRVKAEVPSPAARLQEARLRAEAQFEAQAAEAAGWCALVLVDMTTSLDKVYPSRTAIAATPKGHLTELSRDTAKALVERVAAGCPGGTTLLIVAYADATCVTTYYGRADGFSPAKCAWPDGCKGKVSNHQLPASYANTLLVNEPGKKVALVWVSDAISNKDKPLTVQAYGQDGAWRLTEGTSSTALLTNPSVRSVTFAHLDPVQGAHLRTALDKLQLPALSMRVRDQEEPIPTIEQVISKLTAPRTE